MTPQQRTGGGDGDEDCRAAEESAAAPPTYLAVTIPTSTYEWRGRAQKRGDQVERVSFCIPAGSVLRRAPAEWQDAMMVAVRAAFPAHAKPQRYNSPMSHSFVWTVEFTHFRSQCDECARLAKHAKVLGTALCDAERGGAVTLRLPMRLPMRLPL